VKQAHANVQAGKQAKAQAQAHSHSHSIEVAHLVKGEVVSVRTLSGAQIRWAAAGAAGAVLASTAVAALLTGALFSATSRVVHVPSFVAMWAALGAALALSAVGRARARAGLYKVGVDIDDDAFAPLSLPLVHRQAGGYELSLAPGMFGVVEDGHRTLAIEALVRDGRASVPLALGVRAEVTMATTTFVVNGIPDRAVTEPLARGFWRPFVRRALLPIQLAALVALSRTVPERGRLVDADMKSAIPADATPWEVEKLLRLEAQSQARTLHSCFDSLPLTCQHPGYVGVGLALTRDGEIRSSWIARSTYGRDCPVEACMSSVISTWFFEPLPESMRIVLPVQVLRTDKPMPVHAALDVEPTGRRSAGIAYP
jgi:hypothetical protein